jgi:SulP family sulfate permease
LGGSRVQIGGPTGAFVVIIYGVVQQFGVNGLIVATLIAGVLLVLMGLLRLGSIIKFIPYPVVVGFTSGIAVIIFSSQINDLLGLGLTDLPADFIEKSVIIFQNIGNINPTEFLIGASVILFSILWPKVTTKIPAPFIVILLTSAVVSIFQLPVETVGTRFGDIPHSLQAPHLPHINWADIKILIQPGITIALLAAIEALLSAVVADGMISGKHRSNMELVAQGAANILTPLFGGMPATGAIARTATNVKNGGRTPVAGIIHAVVLLLIMLIFGKWATMIPIATLAGLLMVVAYNMSEWHTFVQQIRGRRSDAIVLLTTFLLTVIIDITVAIQVGVVIAAVMFLRGMTSTASVTAINKEMANDEGIDDWTTFSLVPIPDGVKVFEISGPMFFGAAYKFREALAVTDKPPKIVVIRMRNVPLVDATGIQTLEDVLKTFRRHGTMLVLSGVSDEVLKSLTRSGLTERIGEQNILPTFDDALLRVRVMLKETENAAKASSPTAIS